MCRSWSIIKAEARAGKRTTIRITVVHPEALFPEEPFDPARIARIRAESARQIARAHGAHAPLRNREPGEAANLGAVRGLGRPGKTPNPKWEFTEAI